MESPDKISTADLKRILGQAANAGSPFTAKEVEAVKKELEQREASASAPAPAPPKPAPAAEKTKEKK